jgi:hypothetical protein
MKRNSGSICFGSFILTSTGFEIGSCASGTGVRGGNGFQPLTAFVSSLWDFDSDAEEHEEEFGTLTRAHCGPRRIAFSIIL